MARLFGVDLAEGIQRKHFVAYLLVVFISSGYAGALAVLQPGLLAAMGIEQAQQGTLTGMLAAMQELMFILLMAVIGAWSDQLGRRWVYAAGLATVGVGFMLYPHASSIAELFAFRFIIALGSAAMVGMMVTVVADYAADKARGRANGMQGAVATFGAFIPPILAVLPSVFTRDGHSQLAAQQFTFAIAGSLGMVGALIAAWGLFAGKPPQTEQQQSQPLVQRLRAGLTAARDPHTALSYGAAFISRGDLAVTGAFMSLWLVQYGVSELGLSASEAMFQLAVPRTLAVVVGALLGSILMGQIADRISRTAAVSLASGLAAAVYLAVFFITDPSQTWVMGLLFVMGIAEISAFVSSQALVGQQAPAADRGAIIGFFGVSGAFGILLGTSGGGWLFSNISPSAPFVLFGVLNAGVFFWSLRLLNKPEQLPVADYQG